MAQIAVRLDETELAAVDHLVASGRFPSRAAAVRAALAMQRHAEAERDIAAEYARGYGLRPAHAAGPIAAAAIAEFYRDEPPWDDPA